MQYLKKWINNFYILLRITWIFILRTSLTPFKLAHLKIGFFRIQHASRNRLRMDRGRRSANSYSYGRLAFGTVDFATVYARAYR